MAIALRTDTILPVSFLTKRGRIHIQLLVLV